MPLYLLYVCLYNGKSIVALQEMFYDGIVQIPLLTIYCNSRGRGLSRPRLGALLVLPPLRAPRHDNFIGIALCALMWHNRRSDDEFPTVRFVEDCRRRRSA
jgi:hypothetical protein